jgi:hypothetical protein
MVISLVGAGVLWMFGKHVERKLSISKRNNKTSWISFIMIGTNRLSWSFLMGEEEDEKETSRSDLIYRFRLFSTDSRCAGWRSS